METFQPFNDEWRSQVKRFPKKMILTLFIGVAEDVSKLNKTQLIERLRAELIVKQFNKWYPVGCTLLWKSISTPNCKPIQVTVKYPAYIAASGQPVAFFKERSGYCSVEPQFIVIPKTPHYQFKIDEWQAAYDHEAKSTLIQNTMSQIGKIFTKE